MVVATLDHPDAFLRHAVPVSCLVGTFAILAPGGSMDARVGGIAVGAEMFVSAVVRCADGTGFRGLELCPLVAEALTSCALVSGAGGEVLASLVDASEDLDSFLDQAIVCFPIGDCNDD